MIFTLTNRDYEALDAYQTDDYLIGQYIGSIIETLDINIAVKSAKAELWTEGNYIMCVDKSGRGRWFTISEVKDSLDGDDKSLSAYSGTIDILAEEYPPFGAPEAKPFEWYFNKIFYDTGIVLGINEIDNLTRKLEFESQNATNAEMLQFVLNAFDSAEAQLEVVFDGVAPQKLILNVFKRLGHEEPQTLLSDEDDSLTELDRTRSITDLGTSLLPTAQGEGENNTITLKGKYFEEKDADENLLYYSPKDEPNILSVVGRNNYFVKLPGKADGELDGYINRNYSSQAKTQDALWTEGLAQLKKIDHAIVEYAAKGNIDCTIGDNIQIVSHRMKPPVMVGARVVEYKFNDDDKERNEYKFSNYVELESHMNELDRIVAELKEYAQQVARTYIFSILNVGSPMFKNGEGEVTFTAKIEKNNQDFTDEFTKFNWIKQKKDGSLDTTWNEAHKNFGKTLTVKPEDFEDTATFSYETLQEGLSIGGASGVVTKVYDGKKGDKGDPGNQGIPGPIGPDGKTPYTHYTYAWSTDGTDRFTDTYPAENLLKNSNNFERNWSYSNISDTSNVEGYNGLRGIKLNYLSNTWNGIYQHYPIKAGDTLTYSFYAKTTGRIYFNIGGGARVINEIGTGDWKYYSVTGTYNTDETKAFGVYLHSLNPTDGLIFSAPKLEYRDKSTMYTPAPTDDFENAYPTYSGTYTDYTAQDSQNPADYTWTRILGESGQDGKDGVGVASTAITYQASTSGTTAPTGTWSTTIPEVPAGQFLWTKTVTTYTNNTNSTAYTVAKMGSDGKPGSNGVSVSSVVEEYYVSTSPTSQAGGSWSTTVPNNADPNKYIWRRLKTTMSNGTVTYTNPALIQGMTGIYPYIGPTQPANPKEGQQWWKSDASGNVTNFYVYKSGSWQGQTIQQSVLNIIALNAVTITGSTITGTDMYGSNFITTFTDVPVPFAGTSKMSGSATLSNGELTIAGTVDNTFPFMTRYTGTGYTLTTYTDSSKTTIRNILAANYDNIVMRDNTKNFGGIIQASMLSNTPWINLNLRTGYAISENNRPQYRVTYNLDGTQHLSFRGQFKKSDNSKMVAGSDQHPFDIPSSLAPATTVMSYGGASTGTGSRPYVTSGGYFGTIIGSSATDYVDISMVTYDI